jgi:hypothetical protein
MPKEVTEFSSNHQSGARGLMRPWTRNEEAVALGTFVGGLARVALRQVRKDAAIIAWMRSTMLPKARIRLIGRHHMGQATHQGGRRCQKDPEAAQGSEWKITAVPTRATQT